MLLIISLFGGSLWSADSNRKSPARNYPSIFQAWNGIENKPGENELTRLARHDLVFAGPWVFEAVWKVSPEQPYQGLSTELVNKDGGASLSSSSKKRGKLLNMNPNLKILCELRYREGRYVKKAEPKYWKRGDYPPKSPYWLKDENGKLAPGWGEDKDGDGKVELDEINYMLVDFTRESFQDLIAQKALALKKSGLFDGIMLDWWKETHATSGKWPNWNGTHLTRKEETAARISILKKIRAKVGDNFLILVNSNFSKIPKSSPYVNGIFMESHKSKYNEGYSLDKIKKMEKTLLWAESNLKKPRINCLEGWRVVTQYKGDQKVRVVERNSEENRKWMRLVTTLGLTFSDGYVLFGDDNAQPSPDHLHNWYDFWDADLGRPVGKKGAVHNGVPGLFVREFENGWAVYNRSGATQSVSFPQKVIGVKNAKSGKSGRIPNMDGEIFLKLKADR